MKEIIDQYSPILEGKVEVADVKKLQKDIRLNGSKSQSSKQSQKPLHKLNKLNTSDKEATTNVTSSSSSHKTTE